MLRPADQFVERRGSELILAGNRFRFASLNAPELLDGDVNGPFEVRDTFASLAAENAFGTAVTRTYTLRVRVDFVSAFSVSEDADQYFENV